MRPPITSSLIAMLAAVVAFMAAVVWGAAYAFPEPDAGAEKAAQMHLHAQASGWLMLGSIVLFLGALSRLLWHWRRSRPRSAS